MTTPQIDYRTLFYATPTPYLVLGPDLVIIDVNQAYLVATGRTREDLIGQYIFEAFPENPGDPNTNGARNLNASLHRVLRSRKPDTMAVQKYDIPVADRPGVFEERWWSPINTPVLGPEGQVAWIIHRVADVTAFLLSQPTRSRGPLSERDAVEAELFARARELQRLNEELRQAHAREREVAVALQEAMLRSPDLARHPNIAVRYLPAAGSLNACGDWYDVVNLSDDIFTVAVGDVVGHGIGAAAVMGMLRSALSAAVRAVRKAGDALDVLGLYARSVEGALATTVVNAVINGRERSITYSSAGHLPAVLVHADGTHELLDQATDPPLGTRPTHLALPEATLRYSSGDVLALYTDGLVERRGEDIDVGLHRLTETLTSNSHLGIEQLADTLLARLGVGGGGDDDIALILVRL
ncbi:PP2C family protein-serine/threonine phosphatase [Streptomyces sp. NBC_01803]|uniref:PP2C family protein-serine/threonine phosphatase n=1 Tax=Streptomyces sp. NBC_01803 TaxID=2975946 RepID=UPI002DDC8DD5|nr:SpoIIE family protein phosphatase [Streptomyces sp. NBC_01803]WSA45175.1 SpoIIE family protein phosphatase [Streptomyces sp. NBC_01803]